MDGATGELLKRSETYMDEGEVRVRLWTGNESDHSEDRTASAREAANFREREEIKARVADSAAADQRVAELESLVGSMARALMANGAITAEQASAIGLPTSEEA
jgi:hypothetical protein